MIASERPLPSICFYGPDLRYFGVIENLRLRWALRRRQPPKPGPFRGKVAIVTGASAGIGRAVALQLAEQGARVALAARSRARLNEVADLCRRDGGDAIAIPTDVRSERQCRALVATVVEQFGALDLLVNNAGIGVGALFEDLPDLTLFKQVMEVNFYGQVHCAYYALPHLKQTRGRIVGVSSLGGKFALPYNTSYSASKFGLNGFYDSLRMELAQSGVSVTVICPYWVITEFHERQMNRDGEPRGPIGRALYNDRMMTADQCAAATLRAAAARRGEVLLGPGWLAAGARLIAPRLVDWMTIKFFLEPAAKRIKQARANKPAAPTPQSG